MQDDREIMQLDSQLPGVCDTESEAVVASAFFACGRIAVENADPAAPNLDSRKARAVIVGNGATAGATHSRE